MTIRSHNPATFSTPLSKKPACSPGQTEICQQLQDSVEIQKEGNVTALYSAGASVLGSSLLVTGSLLQGSARTIAGLGPTGLTVAGLVVMGLAGVAALAAHSLWSKSENVADVAYFQSIQNNHFSTDEFWGLRDKLYWLDTHCAKICESARNQIQGSK